MLPGLKIHHDSDNISWHDQIRVHKEQLERLNAEMKAIDILNGIPTDITTTSKCKKFKHQLGCVNIDRAEEGVDQFNIELICDIALGKVSLPTTASKAMSSSNNSVNSDDTIFGAKSRPPARKRDKKKSKKTRSSNSPDSESENNTQSRNSSESESEDENLNSE